MPRSNPGEQWSCPYCPKTILARNKDRHLEEVEACRLKHEAAENEKKELNKQRFFGGSGSKAAPSAKADGGSSATPVHPAEKDRLQKHSDPLVAFSEVLVEKMSSQLILPLQQKMEFMESRLVSKVSAMQNQVSLIE